jgi:hypothetical protein
MGAFRLFRGRPLPPFPTSALPGTPDKVAVLAERARLRQALWHPQDARLDADGQVVHACTPPAALPEPELEPALATEFATESIHEEAATADVVLSA